MADDIIQFQEGRIAALKGKTRDRRRKADWLEGYDMEAAQRPGKVTYEGIRDTIHRLMEMGKWESIDG